MVLLAAFIIYRQITSAFRPLRKAAQAMAAVSKGDLSTAVECNTNNEITEMLTGIQHMRDNLREIIDAIHRATDELNQVANEVRSGAEARNQMRSARSWTPSGASPNTRTCSH